MAPIPVRGRTFNRYRSELAAEANPNVGSERIAAASSSSPSVLIEQALAEYDRAREGAAGLWHKRELLIALLGPAIGRSFDDEYDRMGEGYDEAFDNLWRALRIVMDDRDFLSERCANLRSLLTVAAIDTRTRFKRARMGIPPLSVVVADLHRSIDAAEKAAEAAEFGLCCIHLRHALDLSRMTVLADRFDPEPGAEVADEDAQYAADFADGAEDPADGTWEG